MDAPENKDDMRRYCQEVDGPKLTTLLEVMLNKGTAVRDARAASGTAEVALLAYEKKLLMTKRLSS